MSETVVVTESTNAKVLVEEEVVRIVTTGTQGPAGGSGPLRSQVLTWASSLTVNWSNADVVRVTLGGPTTMTFTGAQDGQRLLLEVTQDVTGGRTVTWPASLRYSSTIPAIALSAAGGKLDRIGFIYRSGTSTYDVIAIAIGF